METKTKKIFVRAWKEEFEFTSKAHALQSKLENAQILEKPTKRLENQIKTANKKVDEAANIIVNLIENGEAPKNAPDLCADELGPLRGYVGDCYCSLWFDFAPSENSI